MTYYVAQNEPFYNEYKYKIQTMLAYLGEFDFNETFKSILIHSSFGLHKDYCFTLNS